MASELQKLKRFVKEEENVLGILQRYFQRYVKHEEMVSGEAKQAATDLGEIKALEVREQSKRVAGWLAVSYDMYNLKLDNADDVRRKFLPVLEQLRGSLDVLKDTADSQHKQQRKLTPEGRTAMLSRVKQQTRKYLTQRNTVHRLLQQYHAKSSLSEFSQYIERITNLLQKIKSSK